MWLRTGVGVVLVLLLPINKPAEPINPDTGLVSESRLRWRDNSIPPPPLPLPPPPTPPPPLLPPLPFFRLESGVLAVLPMPNSRGGGSRVGLRPLDGVPRSGEVSDDPPRGPDPALLPSLSERLLSERVLESLDRPES